MKNILLNLTFLLCATLLAMNTSAQLKSALPLEAYGVWDRTPYTPTDNTHIGLFKGMQIYYAWSDLEPQKDVFDWTALDADLQFAVDNDLFVYLSIDPGPDCPAWVYDTVEKLLTDFDKWNGEFPNYLNPLYKTYFFNMIDKFAAKLASLDAEKRSKIAFMQVKTGATGDEAPIKGNYLSSSPYELYKADPEWQEFRVETFEHHKIAFDNAGLDIPFLFNDIDYTEDSDTLAWNWVSTNIGEGFGVKGYGGARGHHLNNEKRNKEIWIDYLLNPMELALFTRAEMDQAHTKPIFNINKYIGWYWGVLNALEEGLAVYDVTRTGVQSWDDYPEVITSLEFFNKHASQIYPATAAYAYSMFHEGLNSGNIGKFPESTYGPANKNNEARYLAICAAYANRGAQMDDVYAATRGQVYNRNDQTGYNDAGWDIHEGNYERWIEQIDPDGTSIGLFRLNANDQGLLDANNSKYDRFARRFDHATGKDAMYFKFHDDVFSEAGPAVLTFKITWLDKYENSSWAFKYDKGGDSLTTAQTFTGNGSNAWLTETIIVTDAVMQNGGSLGSDFALVNTDNIDDIFHGFEVNILRVGSTAAVEGVSISNCPRLKIPVGSVYQLKASVSPANASDPRVSWSSSDTTVAKVDANGAITTMVEGSAIITVTTNEGGFTDNCTINVGIPDEEYSIINRATGKKIKPAGYNVGDNIVQTPASDETTWTKWTKEMVDDTYYYLKNVETGMYFRPITSDIASLMEQRPTTDVDDWVQWTDITSEGSYVYLVHKETGNYIRPVTGDDNSPIELRPTSRTGNWTQWLLQEETSQVINVTGVSISGCPTADLTEGDTHQLSATVSPVDATDQSVTWISSNMSVASVSNAGLVTAIGAGSAEINVTTKDGGFSETCKVDVVKAVVPVNGISISGCPSDSLSMGGTYQLEAFISPDDADDQDFSWSSSNTSVASIDANGIITAIAEGNSTISVISNDGGFTDECIVAVKDTMTTLIEFDKYNSDISVYLNPVSKELNITFSKTDHQRELKIFNAMGALLLAEEVIDLKKTLNIKKLKMHGLVIIQIKTGRDVFTKKVMVN